MHQGGIVPGALGMERLVLAQAGERIIPIGAGRAETADRALFGDVNIYGVQDKRGVADELAWLAITNGSV
jgi:hypothetical protein